MCFSWSDKTFEIFSNPTFNSILCTFQLLVTLNVPIYVVCSSKKFSPYCNLRFISLDLAIKKPVVQNLKFYFFFLRSTLWKSTKISIEQKYKNSFFVKNFLQFYGQLNWKLSGNCCNSSTFWSKFMALEWSETCKSLKWRPRAFFVGWDLGEIQ